MKKYKITKMCSRLLLVIAATLFSTNSFAQTCDFTVNNSGTTGGDTEYLLELDAAGNIAAVTPGSGPLNITGIAPGTVVQVLHLVYDSADPPTNVPPVAGDDPAAIVGCTNDHLSALILLECLCEDEEISATYTPGGGDVLTYYLTDASGMILDVNTTGNFGTDEAVGDYFVQVLAYDSANPPTVIPGVGDNISTFSADGCYNPDFLGSACCAQKIVCCGDCDTQPTVDLPCDDGDDCTIDDIEVVLDCDNDIVCTPCAGTVQDCATAGATTTQACEDGDPCTMGEMEVILTCDGSICTPCSGGVTPPSCADAGSLNRGG